MTDWEKEYKKDDDGFKEEASYSFYDRKGKKREQHLSTFDFPPSMTEGQEAQRLQELEDIRRQARAEGRQKAQIEADEALARKLERGESSQRLQVEQQRPQSLSIHLNAESMRLDGESKALHVEAKPGSSVNVYGLHLPIDQHDLSKRVSCLRKYAKEALEGTDIAFGLETYVPLEGSLPGSSATYGMHAKIMEFLHPNNAQRIFLLQGSSGAGKTLFGRHLEQSLWEQYDEKNPNTPIPLFISLPKVSDPYYHVVEEALKKKGWEERDIAALKTQKKPLVLYLDGYDELHTDKNLYFTNELNLWNAKIIITCRSQSWYLTGDYRKLFTIQHNNAAKDLASLAEGCLVGFNNTQIDRYIQRYTQTEESEWKDWQKYKVAIDEVPGLRDAIREPLFLRLLLTALPSMQKQGMLASTLTRADIYDAFMEQWLEKQIFRLKHAQLTANEKKYIELISVFKDDKIKRVFKEYSRTVAWNMVQNKKTHIAAQNEDYDSEEEDTLNPDSRHFNHSDKRKLAELFIGFKGSPLKRTGDGKYEFMHASFRDFFAAQRLLMQIIYGDEKEKSISLGQRLKPEYYINQLLLVSQPMVLHFMADKLHCVNVKRYGALKELLFEIVASTRTNKNLNIAAANAITVLNYGHVTLARQDFSRVHIQGADLSGANLDDSNFSESDLTNVIFARAWLRRVKFDKSIVQDMQLGESPSIQVGCSLKYTSANSLNTIAVSNDGNLIFSGSDDGVIRIWDRLHSVLKTKLKTPNFSSLLGIIKLLITSDGQYLIAAHSCNVDIWDLQSKTLKQRINLKSDEIADIILFEQTHKVMAVTKDNMLHTWTLHETCKSSHPFQGLSDSCFLKIAITLDGKRTVIETDKDLILLIDPDRKGYRVHALPQNKTTTDSLTSMALTRDGLHLIVGTAEGYLHKFDCIQEKWIAYRQGHAGRAIHCIALTADESHIISGGEDNTLHIWSKENLLLIDRLAGHNYYLKSAVLSPSKQEIVSADAEGKISFWNLKHVLSQSKALPSLQNEPCALAKDGSIIQAKGNSIERIQSNASLYGFGKKNIASNTEVPKDIVLDPRVESIWQNLRTCPILELFLPLEQDAIKRIILIEQDELIITGHQSGVIKCWDNHGKQQFLLSGGHFSQIECLATTCDYQRIISADRYGIICVWNRATRALEQVLEAASWVNMVAAHPTLPYVFATGDSSKKCTVWDLKTGKKVEHTLPSAVMATTFDDKKIIAGGEFGVKIINDFRKARSSNFFLEVNANAGNFIFLAISKAGQLLYGSERGQVYQYYFHTEEAVLLMDVRMGVWQYFMHADCRSLLAQGLNEGALQYWQIDGTYKHASLQWSAGHNKLVADQASWHNVQGLSIENARLLKQKSDNVAYPTAESANTASVINPLHTVIKAQSLWRGYRERMRQRSPEDCVIYARMLCNKGAYEQAIPYLKKACAFSQLKHDERMKIWEQYNAKTAWEARIKEVIDFHRQGRQCVELSPMIMAYYLLIIAHTELNRIEAAKRYIAPMQQCVSQEKEQVAYLFLGYACKYAQCYGEAANAFMLALDKHPFTAAQLYESWDEKLFKEPIEKARKQCLRFLSQLPIAQPFLEKEAGIKKIQDKWRHYVATKKRPNHRGFFSRAPMLFDFLSNAGSAMEEPNDYSFPPSPTDAQVLDAEHLCPARHQVSEERQQEWEAHAETHQAALHKVQRYWRNKVQTRWQASSIAQIDKSFPDNPFSLLDAIFYAYNYFDQKRYQEAIVWLRQARSLLPENTRIIIDFSAISELPYTLQQKILLPDKKGNAADLIVYLEVQSELQSALYPSHLLPKAPLEENTMEKETNENPYPFLPSQTVQAVQSFWHTKTAYDQHAQTIQALAAQLPDTLPFTNEGIAISEDVGRSEQQEAYGHIKKMLNMLASSSETKDSHGR